MEQKSDKKVIAGFLAMALDFEDRMSISVYADYLERDVWPSMLEEKSFEIIKKLLMILINETEEHKKAFLDLKNRLQ